MRLASKHHMAELGYTFDLAPQLAAGEEPISTDLAMTVAAGDVVCNPVSVQLQGRTVAFTLSGGTAWTDCLLQLFARTDKGEALAIDLEVFIL